MTNSKEPKVRHKNSVELTIRKNKESLYVSVATVFREKVLQENNMIYFLLQKERIRKM